MGIDRRNFLKTLGVVGTTLAVGKTFAGESKPFDSSEFHGILYDSVRCTGCQNCELGCSAANGFPDPTDTPAVGITRKTSTTNYMVLNAFKTPKGEVFSKTQCMHCSEPACAAACLTQAMYKTKEGPVIWRGNKCMGCRFCMVSCPFDVPKFEYFSSNPKIQKCTMCYEKLKSGEFTVPGCVDYCPEEALVFGPRRELVKEAHKRIVENPDKYNDYVFGEHEAAGTGVMMLAPVPQEQLGQRTYLQKASYPELSKWFLYSVPAVFVLVPPLLLGMHEATKKNQPNEEEEGV